MRNLLVYTFLLLYSLANAQHLPLREATPESAGMSAERLRRLDGLLQRYVTEERLPGMTGIVVRDGKIVWHKAFGTRDLDAGDPLQRDDIYRIASMTKAVTSVAAMMLFEEGKFSLDDPIANYLPAFKNPKVLVDYNREANTWNAVPARSDITVRQLLNHTSGIGYGPLTNDDFKLMYEKAGVYVLSTTADISLQENINRLATMPLVHHPGEAWTYGLNTDVLGHLVEIWSGMSLEAFFRTRIFEPLGMKDTYFYLPEGKKDRLVPIYTESGDPKTLQKLPPQYGYDPDYPVKGAKKLYSGGAGLCSTALDYAIFLQMLLNNGEYNGQQLLGRKTIELLTMNQIGDIKMWNPTDQFSLGFSLVTEKNVWRGPGSVGKISWGGYFSTHYFADPQERLTVVLMKQLQGDNRGGDLMPLFEAIVYGAIK